MSLTSPPRPPRVFISYSHDSEEHRGYVLALANRLREDGIDAQIDRYLTVPDQGFPRWMEQQIQQSDFVLIVCTSTYSKRFVGDEQPGKGLGARWEGAIITQRLYEAGASNSIFIPILLGDAVPEDRPLALRSTTYYRPDTPAGYEDLYRRLTNQHATPPPPLGKLRELSPTSTPPLFANPIRSLDMGLLYSPSPLWEQILRDVFMHEQIYKPEIAPYLMVGLTPHAPLAPIAMDEHSDELFRSLCLPLFMTAPFVMKMERGIMHVPYRNEATRYDESVGYAYDEGSIGVAVNLSPGAVKDDPATPWNLDLVYLWKTLHRLLTWSARWPRQLLSYDGALLCRIALGNIANVVAMVPQRSQFTVPAGARNTLPQWALEREWARSTDPHDVIEDVLASLARRLQFPNYQAIKGELRAAAMK